MPHQPQLALSVATGFSDLQTLVCPFQTRSDRVNGRKLEFPKRFQDGVVGEEKYLLSARVQVVGMRQHQASSQRRRRLGAFYFFLHAARSPSPSATAAA